VEFFTIVNNVYVAVGLDGDGAVVLELDEEAAALTEFESRFVGEAEMVGFASCNGEADV
jgi:hypothetical protein